MATRLKVVDKPDDVANAAPLPAFDVAPTRNRVAGWTADRQRTFIRILSMTGCDDHLGGDGTLAMDRRLPSERHQTWLLAHLDPAQFGGRGRRARVTSAHRGG